MQPTRLAALDMGDRLPISNGHKEESRIRKRVYWYYNGEIAWTLVMQPTRLAALDMGDSLPISNGHKDKEAGLLIL